MYRLSYLEVQSGSGEAARRGEARVLSGLVQRLESAARPETSVTERTLALHEMRQLWMAFIDDLATPGNALPQDLRAGLISIGLSLMRQADTIDLATGEGFSDLAEINALVLEGLR